MQTIFAELREEFAIVMQEGDMLREGMDIADAMDEGVAHVMANIGAGLGDERDAAAAHSFRADQAEAFLNAGQDENVAGAHKFRNVVAMTENADARMSELGRQFFAVSGKEFSGDEELAVLMGG